MSLWVHPSVPHLLSRLIKLIEGRSRAVTCSVVLLLGAKLFYWHKYSFWSRRNVKTPPPLPFFGNFLTIMRRPRQELELEWPKRYGKIYGFYLGTKPYLVVADPKVVAQICIKDFDKFPNHFFIPVPNRFEREFLFMSKDNRWRELRNLMSPTFASGKIRNMYKVMCSTGVRLVEYLDRIVSEQGQMSRQDPRDLFSAYSIETALGCLFSIDLSQERPSGELDGGDSVSRAFEEHARGAFTVHKFRQVVSSLLPHGLLRAINFHTVPEKDMRFFAAQTESLIRRRLAGSKTYNDFLQLLLDARGGAEEQDDGGPEGTRPKAASRRPKLRLTHYEASCQAIALMAVASESISTLLANTIYLLSQHLEVQERLHAELAKIQEPDDGSFSYEAITSCTYLECVLSESMRLMAPVLTVDRVANEDYLIGGDYNIEVPKGTVVSLAIYSIHRDPDCWPEPDKFEPERFSGAKLATGSYFPFGLGPRYCIALRFALIEAKLGLAKAISGFRFNPAPGVKFPPEAVNRTLLLNDNKELTVLLERRQP